MTFWLVIIVMGAAGGGNPAMLHVGSFSSDKDCQSAARAATFPRTPPTNPPSPTFICVQANDAGSAAPPK